ncbi:imidazolonepropionase-like amidohydrolase [Algoriphagus boseongensis]|uniref:Imidazolonepropionase-like amidohydrolase n=1 Tax=Algoriphagus boseongensis TaxID=1442587 RepID=A0A4R6TB90_9BACT|nr:amidohydrolase family protein [Algoriphagus boseongensis]TDQ18734.1 imidazolonepropionase-like amidohydrolase [Algoriphagus boseongensis]
MKKNFLKAGFLGLLVSVVFAQSSLAQSDPSGKRRVTGTYAITNATLFSSPGQQGSKGTILIKDGVILGVGSGVQIPKEARVIAGDSLYVYPGFIDGAGNMGVTRPKDPERPKDMVSSNPPDEIAGITPWRSVTDQYSASASMVNDWRKAGFTISQVFPEGGMIPGKGAIMVLGDADGNNLIQLNSALSANFRGSRGMYPATAVGVMAKFREVYQNSSLALEHEKLFASTSGVKRPQITPTQSGMAAVIQKQIPVIFTTSNDLEVRRAISLQKELGFKLVLTGLENYEPVIDLIKSSNTPVLIKLEIPDDKAIKGQKEEGVTEATKAQYARVKEAYDKSLKQASLLEKAGIPFAFTTVDAKAGDAHKALKSMIENGLSEKAALAALTTNAASILGISRMAGTIEKGKMANFVLLTDTLFTENAQVKHVIADGYVFDFEVKKKAATNGKTENSGAIKVEGVWEYTSETPAGASGGELVIKKEGTGYSGTITYDDPAGTGKASSPIKNVTLSGSNMSFEFDVNAGGMSLTVTVTGEITGNTMDGSMSIAQFGSFPLSAKLASPSRNN